MEQVPHSQSFLRKRKMMMVLPLLVLPFITMAFWALGGGRASGKEEKHSKEDNGLNLQLPGANLKAEKGLDKMSYYEMAEADSEKLKERMRSDPYFKLKNTVEGDQTFSLKDNLGADSIASFSMKGLKLSPYTKKGSVDTNEKQVYDKIKQINAALDNATAASQSTAASSSNTNKYGDYPPLNEPLGSEPAINSQNIDRLEKMLKNIKEPAEAGDSEMTQINAMLEKVIDIQHPERLNEKYKQNAVEQKEVKYAVRATNENHTGFYSESTDSLHVINQSPDAFEASVYETQTLVNGATIKLRLLTDVNINGVSVPKDNFVFGKVSLAGERLTVTINSIRYQNSLLPVELSVYDLDGMDGIYIPGAITRDVAKQSTDNALQSIALNSLDPSIGAQAASAGIETAKTLISKKVKLVRVTVKAGYHVLLKDTNNK